MGVPLDNVHRYLDSTNQSILDWKYFTMPFQVQAFTLAINNTHATWGYCKGWSDQNSKAQRFRFESQVSFISVSYFWENLGNRSEVSYCLQWFNDFFFNTPSETSSESPPPPGGHPSTTPAPSVAHEPNPLTPSEIGTSGGHNLVEKVDSKTLPFARQTRRELPRIATNGTLGRPQPHQQHTVSFISVSYFWENLGNRGV